MIILKNERDADSLMLILLHNGYKVMYEKREEHAIIQRTPNEYIVFYERVAE